MGEPLDAETPDTVEKKLETMPETDEPLDLINGENEKEMEMPEARHERLRPEDEEIEDMTKSNHLFFYIVEHLVIRSLQKCLQLK